MVLLVHMLFGAAIGASVANIPLAILLAFLGHYFLDAFPHIEYLAGVENSIKGLVGNAWQKKRWMMLKVLLDFLLGVLLISIFSHGSLRHQLIIYLCGLVAIVPDGLTVLHSLFPTKISTWHHSIHSGKIHYLTKQKNFPKFWKVFTQAAAVIISVILLTR